MLQDKKKNDGIFIPEKVLEKESMTDISKNNTGNIEGDLAILIYLPSP